MTVVSELSGRSGCETRAAYSAAAMPARLPKTLMSSSEFDPRRFAPCTETQADPVPEKTRRNFCEFFYFSREPFVAASGQAKRESDARKKLDSLFGKPATPKPGDARSKLDSLFRKDPPERPDDSG